MPSTTTGDAAYIGTASGDICISGSELFNAAYLGEATGVNVLPATTVDPGISYLGTATGLVVLPATASFSAPYAASAQGAPTGALAAAYLGKTRLIDNIELTL